MVDGEAMHPAEPVAACERFAASGGGAWAVAGRHETAMLSTSRLGLQQIRLASGSLGEASRGLGCGPSHRQPAAVRSLLIELRAAPIGRGMGCNGCPACPMDGPVSVFAQEPPPKSRPCWHGKLQGRFALNF